MRFVLHILTVAALLLAAVSTAARADDCCGQITCPHCHHVCKLEVEKEKVKKYCWNVECKPICIPKITFPWQSCCEPKCTSSNMCES